MPTDHSRLQELFVAACDLAPAEQQSFIASNCAEDQELAQELKQLLDHDQSDEGIFADGQLTGGLQFQFDTVSEIEMPEEIGKYRIEKVLGQGGMGIVYLAEQQNPIRNVALKVIRSGRASRELLKRFELEALVLARLQHPGIARIHEAGIFNDGRMDRPFFAMELIEGISLADYVEHHNLNIRDRLGLVVKVCESVHHAHQRGVIHRDLKPANVLVTDNGDTKVLDFGVARATDADLRVTLQTQTGQMIGTLPYMSPEQISGSESDIDIRADIYSMGVMAYEVLTGKLPYDVKGQNLFNAAKAISENPPIPMATLKSGVAGEVETIILKALEKSPERRYQSAAAFSDDISRFLNQEPIVARRVTTIYRLKKFAQRNKFLVVGASSALLFLIMGFVIASYGMFQAQREAKRVAKVNQFMANILVSPDPSVGDANVKMVTVLRDAAKDSSETFEDYPETEADICFLLGKAFSQLSLYEDAVPQLQRSFNLRVEALGPKHRLTRESGAFLVRALVDRQPEASLKLATEILGSVPANELVQPSILNLRRLRAHANYRLSKFDLAESELRELLEIELGQMASDDELVLRTKVLLGLTLKQRAYLAFGPTQDQDRKEAIRLFREAHASYQDMHGPAHGDTIRVLINLAGVLSHDGQNEEAKRLCKLVLEIAPDRFGPNHRFLYITHADLAFLYYQDDNYFDAAKHSVRSVELATKLVGKIDISVVSMMTDALPMLEAAGQFAKGEEYSRMVMTKMVGHPNMETKNRLYLARMLSGQGKMDEAEKHFKQVAESGTFEADRSIACNYSLFWGEHQLLLGNLSEATALFEESGRLLALRGANAHHPRPFRIKDGLARAANK